jgi:hypothetical protein
VLILALASLSMELLAAPESPDLLAERCDRILNDRH